MIFYNLMTLSAAAMLDIAVERQKNDKSDQQPEFRYDFNDISVKNRKQLSQPEQSGASGLYFESIDLLGFSGRFFSAGGSQGYW